MRYVYGPVPSRRLGRSLGIDLVPHKVCSFDCVYCQLGRTTSKTLERKAYVPAGPVLEELERALAGGPEPDCVTIAGSGEPTLNTELGAVIEGIREACALPVAVITNASLLALPDVAAACREADLLVPSLDAGDEETFQAMNRPCAGLGLREVVEGLASFKQAFRGEMRLEVMLVRGVNDDERRIAEIAALLERVRPDRVQLNTVARPSAEESALPVEGKRMREIAARLGGGAEVVGRARPGGGGSGGGRAGREEVLQCIGRRPCSAGDISAALDISPVEASKVLAGLAAAGDAVVERHAGTLYYRAAR